MSRCSQLILLFAAVSTVSFVIAILTDPQLNHRHLYIVYMVICFSYVYVDARSSLLERVTVTSVVFILTSYLIYNTTAIFLTDDPYLVGLRIINYPAIIIGEVMLTHLNGIE